MPTLCLHISTHAREQHPHTHTQKMKKRMMELQD